MSRFAVQMAKVALSYAVAAAGATAGAFTVAGVFGIIKDNANGKKEKEQSKEEAPKTEEKKEEDPKQEEKPAEEPKVEKVEAEVVHDPQQNPGAATA